VNPVQVLKLLAVTGALSVVVAGCASESADDESVGESEDHLLEGRHLAATEVAQHLRNAGFPENEIGRMVCTAKYESSFYERASNRNRNGSLDRGLFQVNTVNLTGRGGCPTHANATDLWDPATNARCAYTIFSALGNNAWYGYKKHKAECDRYPAPGAPTSSAQSGSASQEADGTATSHGDEGQEGGCWSGTLQDMVDARSCVQSKSNGVWYQCMDGGWYRGGNATSGQFGACQGSYHP
jgi:hypothetical protein